MARVSFLVGAYFICSLCRRLATATLAFLRRSPTQKRHKKAHTQTRSQAVGFTVKWQLFRDKLSQHVVQNATAEEITDLIGGIDAAKHLELNRCAVVFTGFHVKALTRFNIRIQTENIDLLGAV